MEDSIKELLNSTNLKDVELALCILRSGNADLKEISNLFWDPLYPNTTHINLDIHLQIIQLFHKYLSFPDGKYGYIGRSSPNRWKTDKEIQEYDEE